MTSVLFSWIGAAIGASFGGLGALTGRAIGGYLDSKIFGAKKIYEPRLQDLTIQTATYGKIIPIIYGKVKIAGNIIWASEIREIPVTTKITQGLILKTTIAEQISYSYFIDIAIALCEGVIDRIERIWIDDKPVNKEQLNFRWYDGSEEQMADPLIALREEYAPAYRGMAYVVFENFQINEYGNRVPNFTFEVVRNLINEDSVERKIQAINIIPGSGEFVYDTKIQYKTTVYEIDGEKIEQKLKSQINNNTEYSKSDSCLAIEQMQEVLPNISWVNVVVSWFASSLDIKACEIYPAVEYNTGMNTTPDEWSVGGVTRANAKQIGRDEKNRPNYGGTISDAALINYLKYLRQQKYNIMLYPILFLDIPGKPWRGKITGQPADLEQFFIKYEKFIMHYAEIAQNYADGILIGSELCGITKIEGALEFFVKIARKVKGL